MARNAAILPIVAITLFLCFLIFAMDSCRADRPDTASTECRGHDGPVYAVTYSPDSRIIATGGADKTARTWDVGTGREIQKYLGHGGAIWSVAIAQNGRTVATGGAEQFVRIWDISNGQAIIPPISLTGGATLTRSLAFSRDGRVLAGVTDRLETDKLRRTSGVVVLWEVPTGKELKKMPATDKYAHIYRLAFSPDGNTLALATSRGIALMDAGTMQERAFLKGQGGNGAWCLAFSPDGRFLATGGNRSHQGKDLPSPVSIWDVEAVRETKVFDGHVGSISAVCFAPDGQTLASGGYDGTLRLWAVDSGRERAVLTSPAGRIRDVAFAPGGRTLAYCGDNGTVRLVDVAKLPR